MVAQGSLREKSEDSKVILTIRPFNSAAKALWIWTCIWYTAELSIFILQCHVKREKNATSKPVAGNRVGSGLEATMVANKRLVGAEPKVNLRECMSLCTSAYSGFETRRRCHQKSKKGSQLVLKQNLCSPWFLKSIERIQQVLKFLKLYMILSALPQRLLKSITQVTQKLWFVLDGIETLLSNFPYVWQ